VLFRILSNQCVNYFPPKEAVMHNYRCFAFIQGECNFEHSHSESTILMGIRVETYFLRSVGVSAVVDELVLLLS